MTKEETAEAIKVMQAYVDGKEIEGKSKNHFDWLYLPTQCWNWKDFEYRIKEQPKLTKEQIENKWLWHKTDEYKFKITAVDEDNFYWTETNHHEIACADINFFQDNCELYRNQDEEN